MGSVRAEPNGAVRRSGREGTGAVIVVGLTASISTVAELAVEAGEVEGRVLLHGSCWDIPGILERLDAGASGFVSAHDRDADLVEAVLRVRRGEVWISPCVAERIDFSRAGRPQLSDRERQVFREYADGLALKQVARRCGLTENTAKAYLDRAKAKYAAVGRAVGNRVDLYRRAVEDGLLPDPLEDLGA